MAMGMTSILISMANYLNLLISAFTFASFYRLERYKKYALHIRRLRIFTACIQWEEAT